MGYVKQRIKVPQRGRRERDEAAAQLFFAVGAERAQGESEAGGESIMDAETIVPGEGAVAGKGERRGNAGSLTGDAHNTVSLGNFAAMQCAALKFPMQCLGEPPRVTGAWAMDGAADGREQIGEQLRAPIKNSA